MNEDERAEQDVFTPKPDLVKGIYRHYKGNNYQVIDVVCHSESHKWFVLYKRLYERDGPELWIRPYGMFFETVEYNGRTVPRFELLSK